LKSSIKNLAIHLKKNLDKIDVSEESKNILKLAEDIFKEEDPKKLTSFIDTLNKSKASFEFVSISKKIKSKHIIHGTILLIIILMSFIGYKLDSIESSTIYTWWVIYIIFVGTQILLDRRKSS